jgi:hypothetical protein
MPAWGHNIANELTTTVFKGIVNMAPKGRQYHARNCGQLIGVMLRAAYFYWKDVPATLEREGLTKLTPEQEKKLEKMSGWELACAHASTLSVRPLKTGSSGIVWVSFIGKNALDAVWRPRAVLAEGHAGAVGAPIRGGPASPLRVATGGAAS